ncbi:hypothetical protein RD792_016968 [Penstemon davidsonii]|uniref:Polygalacturonase n=1 Tax=Penstemon davidsonii TaxID=160366 RepID=A0ABR0CMH4_9LAMI|nr:hypothetical protein RD792_016968 [Penstemon davidsonii]
MVGPTYDPNIRSNLAKILPGIRPYYGVKLRARLLLFDPKPDMLLEGEIVKITSHSIHAVLLGFSSVTIAYEDIREEFKHKCALRIANSVNVTITGITIQNSPKFHIFIGTCQQVNIFNFTVSSPKESPNTDGIHLSRTHQVVIYNSTLAAGDDCISIQLGTSNVQIYDVHCKPGHGYSIGGLGFDKNVAQVSNVSVVKSTISYSLTGVRIKTWQGGSGFVQSILFSNISMSNVKTAITIDQNYCGGPKIFPSTNDTNAVAISGVTYKNITGTYLCRAVSLVCSKYKPCENITIDTIDLIPSVGPMNKCMGHPICSNAFGTLLNNTTPPLKDCLLSEAQPPALPAIAQLPAMPQKLF